MVFRVDKTNDYTTMCNFHLREKSMSLKAKGLLSWMLSNTDDWDYSIAGIVANCKENESAIKTALKELQDFGYLEVKKLNPDENVALIHYEYIIHEKPQKSIGHQGIDFQAVENQAVENQGQRNTNKRNTNITKVIISEDIITTKNQNPKNFLGSGIIKKNKPNLYSQCKDMINAYTNDNVIRNVLFEYLDLWIQIGDKHFPNMWKGLLNKLNKLEDDGQNIEDVIKQSIEKGYTTFYPINDFKKNDKPWNKDVTTTAMNKDEFEANISKMEAEGKRVVF